MKTFSPVAQKSLHYAKYVKVHFRILGTVKINGRETYLLTIDRGQDADFPFELAV